MHLLIFFFDKTAGWVLSKIVTVNRMFRFFLPSFFGRRGMGIVTSICPQAKLVCSVSYIAATSQEMVTEKNSSPGKSPFYFEPGIT